MPEITDREKILAGITIKKLFPSQVDPKARPDLVELITRGYGHENRPKEVQLKDAIDEFYHGEDRTAIYLAELDHKAVSTIVLVHWRDLPNDKRGMLFWPEIAQSSFEIWQKSKRLGNLALDIASIATLPEYQGLGIAQAELRQAIFDLQPGIIVGQTKTLGAVLSLAQVGFDLDYRTFFGQGEVTPGHIQPQTTEHQAILQAYLTAMAEFRDSEVSDKAIYTIKSDFLATTVPDISRLSLKLQQVFQPLVEAQTKLGQTTTAVCPLISIKEEILN